jgi:hypothetical protein
MNMKMNVDAVVPTPSGLRLGCVIRYGDGGPVRFLDATVDWSVFTLEVQQACVAAFDRMLDAEPEDEPLF